jgi:hypothetical protein
MKLLTSRALMLGGLLATPQMVAAFAQGDADAMFDAFNTALLTTSGSDVFYKKSLDSGDPDGSWSGSLDILVAEDAYERTGDPDTRNLVYNLLTTWLNKNPPPWDWDGWNDDIGWFTLALSRGYLITRTDDFLTQAEYGFNYAFGRGWDTQYNGGGIWEQNPEYISELPTKEALSTDSLGKVSCLLYKGTHNATYLDTCKMIYAWTRSTLFNADTGELYTGVNETGYVNTASAAYNQGTFLDFANLLYEITLDNSYYDDAKLALDFGKNSLTVNGIFSNNASYLNTWADGMARGVGNFVRNNRLWGDYYTWMVQNADSILQNRRADRNITWNAWDQATPEDDTLAANQFASAVAWLQYTPVTKPGEIGGIRSFVNNKTGLAIDNGGTYGNGNPVSQWGLNPSLNQKWQLTQNSDDSWNFLSLSTWLSLDCPGGSDEDGLQMIEWETNRDSNQRWVLTQQLDGTYKIENQQTGKVLDGGSNSTDGAPLLQNDWNSGAEQRWILW